MNIRKYKRLNNVNLSLTDHSIIYCNDILMNQDLSELIELMVKGKNPDPSNIKFEDCDTIVANKGTQVLRIPSLFDLRKNVFSGSKALLTMLIREIILANKLQNETLNLLQNLLNNFNFALEIKQVETIQTEIYELTNLRLEIALNEAIETYFSNNFNFNLLNNENENISDDQISLKNSRIIYFKIIEWLSIYLDHNIIVIFDNPYLGLNYLEIDFLRKIINKIPNRILLINTIDKIELTDLDNLSIIFSNLSMNVPVIINDWNDYEFYLSKKYDSRNFLHSLILKIINYFNLYDLEWTKYCELNNDENFFWENHKNKII